MQRLKCIPFVFLVVTVISVLAAWAFHPGELRVEVSASSRSTLRSVTSEIGSAAIVEKAPAQANAGADQTVAVGARVPLDGSHSSDVNGAALTFHWSFVSVPEGSTATLARPTAMDPSFLADRPGNYIVQLVVNDGIVDSFPRTVIISTVNSRAVASAGADQTVPVGTEVMLDGSGSTDVDGDPLSFSWSFVSVPAGSGAVLANPASVRPSFHANVAGEYIVQLIANDGHSGSLPGTVVITTVNSAPVANGGPDQRAVTGQIVQLDGSHSSDVDGDPLTFRWSFISRPPGSAAMLSNTNSVNPTFRTDAAGAYALQLVVHDGHVNSAPDMVRITTGNTRPVANAGPNQTVKMELPANIKGGVSAKALSSAAVAGSLVQLDGSRSTDVDGDLLAFTWSFVSRPTGSAAVLSNLHGVRPTFVPDVAGIYIVQLIVNDGMVNSEPQTVVITTENTAPVAKAGADQTVSVGSTVQLNGTAAFNPENDHLAFSWAFISKPAGSTTSLINSTSVRPLFVADVAGTYVVQLVVNDGVLNSAPDTVTISTINSRPVAAAGAKQSVLPGTTVHLDGHDSSDADQDPLTYRWSLTSRPVGSAAVLSDGNAVSRTFVADAPGVYVAQLIVNDGHVDSHPDTVTITAAAPGSISCGDLFTANITTAGQTDSIIFSGQADHRVTLTLTSSLSFGVPANAKVLSPTAAVVVTFNANSQQQLTLSETGTYIIQVRANDLVQTGSYSLGLECLLPTDPVDVPLACGSLATRSIASRSQVDQLTFNGQMNHKVTLTLTSSLSFGVPATATVFSPTAAVVVTFNANSQQQLTLTETGTYIIQVRANDLVETGSYSLGLECLLPPDPIVAPLACGAMVTRLLASRSQVDQIGFRGQPDGRVRLTLTSSLSFGVPATATVFSPTGALVVTFNANNENQFTLSETGTYIVQVRANDLIETGTYTLQMDCPELTMAKTHVSNFMQGQIGASYALMATNVGSLPTSGTVTVADTLPSALTATGIAGTGWTCAVATLTCTRSDVLAAGLSYPSITLTVNVAGDAPPVVTNIGVVSGGGDVNPGNNIASDPTNITTGQPPIPASVIPYLDLKCYGISNPDGGPLPPLNFPLHLDHLNPLFQQLGIPSEDVILLDPFQVCVPVAKNGVMPPPEALQYIQFIDLKCYHVQTDPTPLNLPLALTHLNPVLQQFPADTVNVQEPQKLCVPVAKSLPDGTPVFPPPGVLQSIQFIDQKGYGILDPNGNPLPPLSVPIHLDHLNTVFQMPGSVVPPEDVVMDVPQQLTVPIAKNGQLPSAADLPVISQIDDKCYALVDTAGLPLPPLNLPQLLWHLNPVLQTLAPEQVLIQEPQQLCVPVQKSLPGANANGTTQNRN